MTKRLMILVATLALVLAAAAPALAQEGTDQGEPANGPPGPPPGETATLAFELAVEGDPPADATFFGFIPAEGSTYVPLTDPDGDGLYTGSTTGSKYPPGPRPVPPHIQPVSLPVQIVQVTWTQGPDVRGNPRPGEPIRVIRDFGTVLLDEDKTFGASVSFEDEGGVPPGPSPDRTATLSFELAVEGEPPADATFFGFIPAEGGISAPLTDPDGDGVYTGSTYVPKFPPGPAPPDAEPVSLPVQIVQAGPQGLRSEALGVIRDFGEVPIDGDKTFRAKVDFDRDEGGATTPEGATPEPGDGGSDDSGGGSGSGAGSSGSGSDGSGSGGSADGGNSGDSGSNGGGSGNGGETGGIRGFLPVGLLPSTGGGISLMVLGAGALLIGGGLLLRKIFR